MLCCESLRRRLSLQTHRRFVSQHMRTVSHPLDPVICTLPHCAAGGGVIPCGDPGLAGDCKPGFVCNSDGTECIPIPPNCVPKTNCSNGQICGTVGGPRLVGTRRRSQRNRARFGPNQRLHQFCSCCGLESILNPPERQQQPAASSTCVEGQAAVSASQQLPSVRCYRSLAHNVACHGACRSLMAVTARFHAAPWAACAPTISRAR